MKCTGVGWIPSWGRNWHYHALTFHDEKQQIKSKLKNDCHTNHGFPDTWYSLMELLWDRTQLHLLSIRCCHPVTLLAPHSSFCQLPHDTLEKGQIRETSSKKLRKRRATAKILGFILFPHATHSHSHSPTQNTCPQRQTYNDGAQASSANELELLEETCQ